LRTTTVFTKMKRLLDDTLNSDECSVLSFTSREVTSFDTPAIVNTLQKAIDYAFLPDVHITAWRLFLKAMSVNIVHIEVQKTIAKHLGKLTSKFNATEFMTRRMARWQPAVSESAREWWSFCGAFVINLCQNELSGAPQCVIATFIKTLLNGWASARRFKAQHTQCAFGCGSRQDSIEHYMECPHVENIWKRTACSEWGPFENRLAVGCLDVNGRVSRVFFLYGLYAAYNVRKHGGIQSNIVDGCANLVKSKISYALVKSTPTMRQRYTGTPQALTMSPQISTISEVLFNFRKRSRHSNKAGKRVRDFAIKRRKL